MKRFVRVETGSMLGGVAAGMAHYFEIDVSLARLLWVALGLSGVGLPVYIIAWLVVPSVPYAAGPGSESAAAWGEAPPPPGEGTGGDHAAAAYPAASAEAGAEEAGSGGAETAPGAASGEGSPGSESRGEASAAGSPGPPAGVPSAPAEAPGAPAGADYSGSGAHGPSPHPHGTPPPASTVKGGAGPKTAGWILVFLGGILLTQQLAPRLLWWLHGRYFWPLVLVAVGFLLIFRQRR